jgi:hypothetical protein
MIISVGRDLADVFEQFQLTFGFAAPCRIGRIRCASAPDSIVVLESLSDLRGGRARR